MNTRDLFELATLDVLGLLDEDERAAFEEAFKAAPPTVQAQVRAEQLRSARFEQAEMLPDVEPPVGLRARVVAAVREAIAAVRTEPVARIGPVVGVAGFNSTPIWRAACIGFATASLVLAGFGVKVARDNRAIAEGAQGIGMMETLVGPGGARLPRVLGDPATRRVAFAPSAKDVDTRDHRPDPAAVLYVDPDGKTFYLFANNLPASSGTYKLVLRTPGDNARFMKEFEATPGTTVITFEMTGVQSLSGMEILEPGSPQEPPRALLVAREL